jgi:molybdopterin-containing oxidoreductase family iron-sulfur binding subunit
MREEPLDTPISRRRFLRVMGASAALAGLSGCVVVPAEKLVPYVRSPEEVVPGQPLFFATAMTQGGYAFGTLVESHAGRPTKIEGNPDHPASLGGTDPYMQATILDLYDPDRSQVPMRRGVVGTWDSFVAAVRDRLKTLRKSGGAGLRLITEPISSPTLVAQIDDLLKHFPAARWIQFESAPQTPSTAGARLAFGREVLPRFDLARADVVVSLDADFLTWGPAKLALARAFSERRLPGVRADRMNRLYTAECTPTLDGAMADHRVAIRPSQLEAVAWALARRVGVPLPPASETGLPTRWLDAAARDLVAHRGKGAVLTGPADGPVVQALGYAINHVLGNAGHTLTYAAPVILLADPFTDLQRVTAEMRAGEVDTVIILGANPVYTAPADLEFSEALAQVPFSVHLGLYRDETGHRCTWHLPEVHCLEGWSDARAFDGTTTVVQPLIAPLYGGKSRHDVLSVLNDRPDEAAHDLIRARHVPSRVRDHGTAWEGILSSGVVPGSALPSEAVTLNVGAIASLPPPRMADPRLEIAFRPDPSVWDGRFNNNAWLQELPKPFTKLTWDNAALISPDTAARHGLANGDVVDLGLHGRKVAAPVWILEGQPEDVVTVHLGYGRTRTGRVGEGAGFDAYRIRTSRAPWHVTGLSLERTGQTYELVTTQHHQTMEGHHLLRSMSLAEFERQLPADRKHAFHLPSLYPDFPAEGHAWGMSINLTTCIGCNACVVACQAENNVPVVGKEEVARNREMHWLRIDRYVEGPPSDPRTGFMPVPCMHCETAPCELVCPTEATVHDHEGLNEMVYQRCVGTRFCSNNCPYKVRRFNFFQYADYTTPSLVPLRNPDVTVRSRGVMEKCTYCIQRINAARVSAEEDGRRIADGEVQTACQAACPTRAIVFGDLNDPESEVRRLKAGPLDYALLGELNTRPRTTYLARVTNPHPRWPEGV